MSLEPLTLTDILIATVPLMLIFATLFAFTTWLERKALARIQNRIGPNKVGIPCTRIGLFGLGQPAADGIKMIFKEDIVPRGADRLFHLLAPILALIPAMLVLCFLPLNFPWIKNIQGLVKPFMLDGAVIFFFAITGLNTLAVFMAGWASRNKYSLLGGIRAVAQMVSYEIPLVLSAVIVVMMVGSLNAAEIVKEQADEYWFILSPWGFTAFVIFFIAALAETNRSPFDLPEAESEIIAGYFTEYSGFKFALFFLGEYIAMFAISGLAVTLFLGGGDGPGVTMNPEDQGLATE
ncbi:MAG: NADH-quinone oxidoreductase subunit H, partial [Verrucomicrobiota bacterium]|nr:NADH-quinone oxidoreductase subunit H [Verrucomicrobiota bacterium]